MVFVLSRIMLFLADEWLVGSIVSIMLVVVGYLVFSILLLIRCRKRGYDVGVSAFIPVVSLFIFIRSFRYRRVGV